MAKNKTENVKESIIKRKQSSGYLVFIRLCKNKAALIGLTILALLVLVAIFAPLIMPYSYNEINPINAFKAPSLTHLFGTDELGRDIFSRLIYGSRYSLQIGILTAVISTAIGVLIGAYVGYYGGLLDNSVMRFMDMVQAIPGLILSIAVSAVLGPGFYNCIIALVIGFIPGNVRMMRASILNIKGMEYLEASTAINCSNKRIIWKHVVPNAFSPMIVQITMGAANAILCATSLSFIGLGIQPPTPEWGAMLTASRTYIRDYPHMVIFPGLVIMIAVLALNMLGDGLRDAMDPKLKD